MKKTYLTLMFLLSLISAQGAILQYSVDLNGPSESPANASPGVGTGTVNYDSVNHTLQLAVTFSGLLGTVTASHIHAATANPFSGTAGVATTTPTFAGFPSGVTSGTYANTLDLTLASSYNPAFVTAKGSIAGAEAALAAAMANGEAYWNIHTTVVPGGEIRGFLVAVPESSTFISGLGALGIAIVSLAKKRGLGIS